MNENEPCPKCSGKGKVLSKSRGELICRACLGKGIKDEEMLRRQIKWENDKARMVIRRGRR